MQRQKIMKCQIEKECTEDSGKYPCSICRKDVGRNSIQGKACKKWVHKKCSGLKCKLGTVVDFECKKCSEPVKMKLDEKSPFSLRSGYVLECVDKFCYLGDMIGSGGGAVEAVRNRVRCAWCKFRELHPTLAMKGFP